MDAGTRAMQEQLSVFFHDPIPVGDALAFHLLLHSYQLSQPEGQPTKSNQLINWNSQYHFLVFLTKSYLVNYLN